MPNKTETCALIEVMQAFVDGKPIQVNTYGDRTDEWYTLKPNDNPNWNWARNKYRIAPLEKPSVDWSQIPDAYRWLAVDANGKAFVYHTEAPRKEALRWECQPTSEGLRVDNIHTSYKRGTVDWRDSLVERPE